MTKSEILRDRPPFSYLVKVGHISVNPVEVKVEANPAELKALALVWNVVEVSSLKANLHIARWKRDGVRIKGRASASLSQACVVTLEPVPETIEEDIDQIFVPEGSKLARAVADGNGEMVLDPDGPDLPEVFAGDTIDAGDVVAEAVALALDPYPRKPGVAFPGHVEDDGAERRPSPFAILKDLKKD